MDAVKFLEEVKRMCESFPRCSSNVEECPLYAVQGRACLGTVADFAEAVIFPKIVDAVEKWSKENPIKTQSSEFLKHYPNATIGRYGVIDICPKAVDKNYTPVKGCDDTSCDECSYEYWSQEVE